MAHIPEDRPMTEAEWERMMKESEARSARYGELLETLMDHPDSDAIISREMGWDQDDDDAEGDEDSNLFAEVDEDDFETEEDDAPSGFDADDDDDPLERRDRREIPGYAQAYDWGLRVHKSLQEFLQSTEEPEPDDPLIEAYSNSLIVAVKIAGGHAMNRDGDDDTLCGNIVCCKRALEAAHRSLAAMQELRSAGILAPAVVDPLLDEGKIVRGLVEERIAELRSRVWWE